MFIDIGAKNAKDAEDMGVSIGLRLRSTGFIKN